MLNLWQPLYVSPSPQPTRCLCGWPDCSRLENSYPFLPAAGLEGGSGGLGCLGTPTSVLSLYPT